MVDHGSRASAHLLDGHLESADGEGGGDDGGATPSMCVTFAGPDEKADDVIARDVDWLITNADVDQVVVVTVDQELIWRCRSAARPEELDYGAVRRLARDTGFGSDGRRKGKRSRSARKRGQPAEQGTPPAAGRRHRPDRGLQHNETGIVAESSEGEDVVDSNNSTVAPPEPELPKVVVITPQRFLEDLDESMTEWLRRREREAGDGTLDDATIPGPVATLRDLFELRGPDTDDRVVPQETLHRSASGT